MKSRMKQLGNVKERIKQWHSCSGARKHDACQRQAETKQETSAGHRELLRHCDCWNDDLMLSAVQGTEKDQEVLWFDV
jgi:hypothetical protein